MGFELLHLSGIVLVKLVAPDFTKASVWIVSKREERLWKASYVPRSKIPRPLYHRKIFENAGGLWLPDISGDEGSFQGISPREERETSKMDISDTSLER